MNAILLVSLLLATSQPPANVSGVSINALGCPSEADVAPELEVDSQPTRLSWTKLDVRTYAAVVPLTPGRHVIDARIAKCGRQFAVVVLPNHVHAVDAVLSAGRMVNSRRSMLAGVLPFAGSVVTLIDDENKERPLQVDGDAFYGDHLRPGKYTLSVRFPYSQAQARFSLQVNVSPCIVNVNIKQLKSAVGDSFWLTPRGQQFEPFWSKETVPTLSCASI